MKELIFILDGSGSMQYNAIEARNGFNKLLDKQKKIGDANATIVWFDGDYEIDYEGRLADVKPLDEWKVGGMTALYDAIGKTFAHVKKRFSKESPESVVLMIQTDGMENSSQEFDSASVKSLIKEHEEKYGWTVIFLGTGLDVARQSADFGIRDENCFTCSTGATGSVLAADVHVRMSTVRESVQEM